MVYHRARARVRFCPTPTRYAITIRSKKAGLLLDMCPYIGENKAMNENKVIIINGVPHFLGRDHNNTLGLWRGTPDDFAPVEVEDERTCDPNLWALILNQFKEA